MTTRKFIALSMLAGTPAAVQLNNGAHLPQRHLVIVNDTKEDVSIRVVSGKLICLKGQLPRIVPDGSALFWSEQAHHTQGNKFTLNTHSAVHGTFGFTEGRGLIITVHAGSEKAVTYHALPNDQSQKNIILKYVKSDTDPLRPLRHSSRQSYLQVGPKVVSLEDNVWYQAKYSRAKRFKKTGLFLTMS